MNFRFLDCVFCNLGIWRLALFLMVCWAVHLVFGICDLYFGFVFCLLVSVAGLYVASFSGWWLRWFSGFWV